MGIVKQKRKGRKEKQRKEKNESLCSGDSEDCISDIDMFKFSNNGDKKCVNNFNQ